jgi:sucrose-phosphate synthase
LWEHLEEWVDNLIAYYEQTETTIDVATGHYGDGGLACAMLKQKKGIPYTFTGHSLGAQKFDKLNRDFVNIFELEEQYFFSKRILAERTAIRYSDVVFVSTKQERDEQYQHPLYHDVSADATFEVVPPGANIEVFRPLGNQPLTSSMRAIEQRMNRHLAEDRRNKAHIIAASRLDPKKNHLGLLQAYAGSPALQEQANLILSVRGIEDVFTDYSQANPNEQAILSSLLDVIRTNRLEGKVAFLNIRTQQELADTYRLLSTKQGIFTLTALYEPFGLAPIEAMSAGLPAVVTKYGGPSDVLRDSDGEYGVLVDALDPTDIADGLLKCLSQHDYYQAQGQYRVQTSYTWAISAQRYLHAIAKIEKDKRHMEIPRYFRTKNPADLDTSFLLSRYR